MASMNLETINLKDIIWFENNSVGEYLLVPFIKDPQSDFCFYNILSGEEICSVSTNVLQTLALGSGVYNFSDSVLKTSRQVLYANYIKCRNLDIMKKVRRCVACAIMENSGSDFKNYTYTAIESFCERKSIDKKELERLVQEISKNKRKEQSEQELEK